MTNSQVIQYISESKDLNFLVSILELTADKSGVNTISETARLNGITPPGVRKSKRYRKVRIGKQLMAISGLNETGLPF